MTNAEGIAEGYLSECEDQVRTLEWQLSEATKANERLRAALEDIANVAHPADMHSVNIARRALGRD